MKKLISLLCVASMAIACVPSAVLSETVEYSPIKNEEVIGDFVYYDYPDDNVMPSINGYIGKSKELVIPDNSYIRGIHLHTVVERVVIGKGVTIEAGQLFYTGKENIKEVIFEEPLKEISSMMFYGCENLERIQFADGTNIKTIGNSAFRDCNNLKNFDFSHIENIGESAFASSGLTELILPETVKTIGFQAFLNCPLENVYLPNGLKEYSLKSWGISGIKNKTINIPDAIVENPKLLSDGSFTGGEINFNGDITIEIYEMVEFSSWCQDKYLKGKTDKNITFEDDFIIVDNTVVKYNGTNKNPIIPEGVQRIYDRAFYKKNIDTVMLPESLIKIGITAFGSSSLREIIIPKSVKVIEMGAFDDCILLKKLVFEGAPEIGEDVLFGCVSLNTGKIEFKDASIVLPDGFECYRQTTTMVDGYRPWEEDDEEKNTPMPSPTNKSNDEDEPTTSPIPTVVPTDEPTLSPKPETSKELTVKTGGDTIEVYADNEVVEFTDVMPFIDSTNRTQMPVRAVAEALGCEVDYVDGLVTIRGRKTTINLTIGSDILTKNGEKVQMDTAAVIISDRTFIPVRYIAEALGYTVNWENMQ